MTHDVKGVRTLLRDLDSRAESLVARTLAVLGCGGLSLAGDLPPGESVDLLIVDAEAAPDQAESLVAALRRGEMGGANAFAVAVLLTGAGGGPACGADWLAAKPLDPVKLAGGITELMRRRRSFIVTPDYLGPDRRLSGRRPDDPAPPRLAVPNPLREAVLNGTGRAQLQRMLTESWRRVEALRGIRP